MIEVDTRLAELGARYRSSLPNKRASVALAWRALRADAGERAHWLELMRVLHRLAGSAPSYGYERIGALASKAEARLDSAWPDGGSAAATVLVQALIEEVSPLVDGLLDALAAELAVEPAKSLPG